MTPSGLYYEPRVGDPVRDGVSAMLVLGLPIAVYVGPPVSDA